MDANTPVILTQAVSVVIGLLPVLVGAVVGFVPAWLNGKISYSRAKKKEYLERFLSGWNHFYVGLAEIESDYKNFNMFIEKVGDSDLVPFDLSRDYKANTRRIGVSLERLAALKKGKVNDQQRLCMERAIEFGSNLLDPDQFAKLTGISLSEVSIPALLIDENFKTQHKVLMEELLKATFNNMKDFYIDPYLRRTKELRDKVIEKLKAM